MDGASGWDWEAVTGRRKKDYDEGVRGGIGRLKGGGFEDAGWDPLAG
jgi:hypothetical protein